MQKFDNRKCLIFGYHFNECERALERPSKCDSCPELFYPENNRVKLSNNVRTYRLRSQYSV